MADSVRTVYPMWGWFLGGGSSRNAQRTRIARLSTRCARYCYSAATTLLCCAVIAPTCRVTRCKVFRILPTALRTSTCSAKLSGAFKRCRDTCFRQLPKNCRTTTQVQVQVNSSSRHRMLLPPACRGEPNRLMPECTAQYPENQQRGQT